MKANTFQNEMPDRVRGVLRGIDNLTLDREEIRLREWFNDKIELEEAIGKAVRSNQLDKVKGWQDRVDNIAELQKWYGKWYCHQHFKVRREAMDDRREKALKELKRGDFTPYPQS